MGNEKKSRQLGMSFNKAQRILKKTILFDLVKKLKLDTCYRCNRRIEDIKNLSIEHKKPWLNSENPIELFFDLNNIAFSHLSCNSACADKTSHRTKEFREKISLATSGENSGKCKLSSKEVDTIRIMTKKGLSSRQIAKKFNVSHTQILDIIKYRQRRRG